MGVITIGVDPTTMPEPERFDGEASPGAEDGFPADVT